MNIFTVRIQRTGTIPIPEPLCRTLGIKPGDRVNVAAARGRIVLTPRPKTASDREITAYRKKKRTSR